MVRTLLIRGMLVGFFAGLLVFGFGRLAGEPPVDRAIKFEAAMEVVKAKADDAHGVHAMEEPELVSRSMQSGLGLATGVIVYSTAFGGLFALVFAFAKGRVGGLGPRALSAMLGVTGFIAVYVVPSLKYPASPPSVGAADTIGQRTALYFIMIALSIGAMIVAVMLRKRLVPRQGLWSAGIISTGVYVALMILVQVLLPSVNEIPENFPAVVLWQFRIASFGMQLVMWTTLGLAFGALTEKAIPARLKRHDAGKAYNSAR